MEGATRVLCARAWPEADLPGVTLSSGVQKQLHHNMACATEKLGAAGSPGEVILLGEG